MVHYNRKEFAVKTVIVVVGIVIAAIIAVLIYVIKRSPVACVKCESATGNIVLVPRGGACPRCGYHPGRVATGRENAP